MIHWFSNRITSDPLDMLWHYIIGQMTFPTRMSNGRIEKVGWIKYSHRGVQFLDKVVFPKKQLRYIFSPRFTVRYNTAFQRILQYCGHPNRDEQGTWISPTVFEGYMRLHRLGYAQSWEAWEDGQLAGGCLAVQIGGFIACNSMFHIASHASKAAWGQTLVRLRERGFKWVDVNGVATHAVNYGDEWVPQCQFEQMLRQELYEMRSLADDIPCPPVPWQVRMALPAARIARGLMRRIGRRQTAYDQPPMPTQSHRGEDREARSSAPSPQVIPGERTL